MSATLRKDLEDLRSRLFSNADHFGVQNDDLTNRLQEVEIEMDEMLDKLWELDKSWKNNLVFYGVKSDESKTLYSFQFQHQKLDHQD